MVPPVGCNVYLRFFILLDFTSLCCSLRTPDDDLARRRQNARIQDLSERWDFGGEIRPIQVPHDSRLFIHHLLCLRGFAYDPGEVSHVCLGDYEEWCGREVTAYKSRGAIVLTKPEFFQRWLGRFDFS